MNTFSFGRPIFYINILICHNLNLIYIYVVLYKLPIFLSVYTFVSLSTWKGSLYTNVCFVVSLAGNDRGEHKNPRMTLTALTQIGEEIPQGVALRLGDGLRFRIQLLDDGTSLSSLNSKFRMLRLCVFALCKLFNIQHISFARWRYCSNLFIAH